jgi:hypothetical protein
MKGWDSPDQNFDHTRYCQDCAAHRPWHRHGSPPQTRDGPRPASGNTVAVGPSITDSLAPAPKRVAFVFRAATTVHFPSRLTSTCIITPLLGLNGAKL